MIYQILISLLFYFGYEDRTIFYKIATINIIYDITYFIFNKILFYGIINYPINDVFIKIYTWIIISALIIVIEDNYFFI